MKKHNKIIAVLVATLLFVGFGASTNQFQIVKADNTVQDQNTSEAQSDSEDYTKIKGHDKDHPIWYHDSLGVIVENNDPILLHAVQDACNNWSPVFTFHDYGYVNMPQGKKLDTEHGKLHFIYIKEADLSSEDDKNDPDTLTEGDCAGPNEVSRKGYFQDKDVTVEIDVNLWNNGTVDDSMSAAVTHEFGHALGLAKHSTNSDDVMYWLIGQNGLQAEEYGAVRRMYQGKQPADYPDQLNFIDPSQQNKSNSKPVNKNLYVNRLTPRSVYHRIFHCLYLIDDNDKVLSYSYQYYFSYHTLHNGRKISNHAHLHNGVYTAVIPLYFTGIKPTNSKRETAMMITKVYYNKGDTVDENQGLSYFNHLKINAHSTRTPKYTFDIKFRLRGHHMTIINKN